MNSASPIPNLTPANTTAAYQLRYHFGWYTHRRQPLLSDARTRGVVEASFAAVTQAQNYHILAVEIEPVVVRALLSLTPDQSPSEVTRRIKGAVAAAVRDEFGTSQLWSRGWFLRSVGSRTNEVVRSYVAAQFEHHRAAPVEQPGLVSLARFHQEGDPARLRTAAHVAFEYNVHFVVVTEGRRDIFDPYVAREIVQYWSRVCEKKGWILWDLEVLPDHAHLFVGLKPAESALRVALSLMNNASWFLEQKHAAVLRREGLPGVWKPGFYTGTVGSASTAQVKAFLRKAEEWTGPHP